jgi:DNA-binding IclR family transcriptional regulator
MRNEHKGRLAAPRVPVGHLRHRTYSRNVTSGAAGGDRDSGPSQVQSVDRAIAILYLLAQHGDAGVTTVANELGVHKSTAFRLIAALEQWNLIEQEGERGKYHLGRGVLRLAAATTARLELPAEARPVCRRLATELGEAVNIAILDNGEATHILQEYAKTAITGRNWLGQRTPLHATASGKVLLAYADPVTVKQTLGVALQPYTPRTVTEPAALEAELAAVRERGWASTAEELEIGLNALAAPIHDGTGEVVAAVGVSGPSYRLTVESFPAAAAHLVAGATEISVRLGHFGPGLVEPQ